MRPTTPVAGQFLYVAWNVQLRLIGPFVLPSVARRRQLAALREPLDHIRSIAGIGEVRSLETTFVVPRRGGPRFDVTLLIDGTDEAVGSARDVIDHSALPPPSFVSSARNVARFGDTEAVDGPILLNHFASCRPAEDIARVWTGISAWYGKSLGVDNSTLLVLDDSSRFVAVNYASVPAPVVRFMANQLLRPSFRSKVVGPLATVDARALPVFARRVTAVRSHSAEA